MVSRCVMRFRFVSVRVLGMKISIDGIGVEGKSCLQAGVLSKVDA